MFARVVIKALTYMYVFPILHVNMKKVFKKFVRGVIKALLRGPYLHVNTKKSIENVCSGCYQGTYYEVQSVQVDK
jgi:hypothetical protein